MSCFDRQVAVIKYSFIKRDYSYCLLNSDTLPLQHIEPCWSLISPYVREMLVSSRTNHKLATTVCWENFNSRLLALWGQTLHSLTLPVIDHFSQPSTWKCLLGISKWVWKIWVSSSSAITLNVHSKSGDNILQPYFAKVTLDLSSEWFSTYQSNTWILYSSTSTLSSIN